MIIRAVVRSAAVAALAAASTAAITSTQGSGAGATSMPPQPAWVGPGGVVDDARAPRRIPVVDARGALVRDEGGSAVFVDFGSAPPPAPALAVVTADRPSSESDVQTRDVDLRRP